MVAVSGGTSTAAMISCCTHYLVNLLPVLGATGIASFVGQYQVQLFWVGLAFNLAGILTIGRRVMKVQFV
jgi:Cu+-exporting ATPase